MVQFSKWHHYLQFVKVKWTARSPEGLMQSYIWAHGAVTQVASGKFPWCQSAVKTYIICFITEEKRICFSDCRLCAFLFTLLTQSLHPWLISNWGKFTPSHSVHSHHVFLHHLTRPSACHYCVITLPLHRRYLAFSLNLHFSASLRFSPPRQTSTCGYSSSCGTGSSELHSFQGLCREGIFSGSNIKLMYRDQLVQCMHSRTKWILQALLLRGNGK